MSINGGITWDTSEWERHLDKVPQAVEEAALEALDEAGDYSVEVMKHLVPVDTGALRDSSRKEPAAHWEGDAFVVGITEGGGGYINPRTGREVDYGRYVEDGTSRQRAQPHLRPALYEAAGQVPRLFKEKFGAKMR